MLSILVAEGVAEIDGYLPAETIEVGAHVVEEVVTGHDMIFVAQLSLDYEGAAIAGALVDIGERSHCNWTRVDSVDQSVGTAYFGRHA